MTDWSTIATWAGVLLGVGVLILSVASRSQSNEQARTVKAVDDLRTWFDKVTDEMRRDARDDARLIDDHMKAIERRADEGIAAQTAELQRNIDAIVPKLQDQISASSEKIARLEEWRKFKNGDRPAT